MKVMQQTESWYTANILNISVINALSIGVVWYCVGGLAVYKTGEHHLSCEILLVLTYNRRREIAQPGHVVQPWQPNYYQT